MTKSIQATQLRRLLESFRRQSVDQDTDTESPPKELAIIDVREVGEYGEGHAFLAVNIPYSRLEIQIKRLLPGKKVPIILFDSGNSISEIAAKRLKQKGYSDLAIVEGGVRAWKQAGFNLFKGLNVPSKSFGELIEHELATPRISASELLQMKKENADLIILDGRTPAEFEKMTIPGARSCPNGELAHRIHKFVKSEETTVVVNCAGRTRSIIGAQTLLNLGIKNKVLALENGTQGWQLAGHGLDFNNKPKVLEALSETDNALSRQNGEMIRSKYQIAAIDDKKLESWQNRQERTTYVLDVRTEEEYLAGHWPHAVHAPGGQLVQATDRWIAVRGARVVLLDDTGLRAAVTAMWLKQMGHNVFVTNFDVAAQDVDRLEVGAGPIDGADDFLPADTLFEDCELSEVSMRQAGGAQILDLNHSMDYRKGHIEGAVWCLRPDLSQLKLDPDREIIVAATTRAAAEIAAADLWEIGYRKLSYLTGTADDWREAGIKVVETPSEPPDNRARDYLFFVHDRHDGNLEAARGYLAWETELIRLMDDQEKSLFEIQRP